jgi:hypothetical protein
MLRFAHRSGEALAIFEDIHQRLLYRRLGQGGQRLIDQSNSWANLLEFIATREEASEAYGRSSYLLQMILEISIRDFGSDGEVFARSIYRHLIQGRGDDGASFELPQRVELVSWAPASDWGEKVLAQYVGGEGVSLTINSYYDHDSSDLSDLPDRISTFVSQSRSEYPLQQPEGVPGSICILACLLHGSPIPPEFWRTGLYDDKPPSPDAA